MSDLQGLKEALEAMKRDPIRRMEPIHITFGKLEEIARLNIAIAERLLEATND